MGLDADADAPGRPAPGRAVRRRLGAGRSRPRRAVSQRHHARSTSSGLESAIDGLEAELEPLDPVHPARRDAGRRAAPPGADGLPPRRAAGRDARPARRARTSPSRSIVYLNRLSDLLFVLARAVNHRAGVADVLWKGI